MLPPGPFPRGGSSPDLAAARGCRTDTGASRGGGTTKIPFDKKNFRRIGSGSIGTVQGLPSQVAVVTTWPTAYESELPLWRREVSTDFTRAVMLARILL